jgi:hypothetical protein
LPSEGGRGGGGGGGGAANAAVKAADAAAKAAEQEEKKTKKELEAAKRAAEEEARRAAKEEQVLKLKREMEAKAAAAAEAAAVAKELVASGLKGKELLAAAKEKGGSVKGSALLGEVLSVQASDEALAGLGWMAGKEYGVALLGLLRGDMEDQKEAVYAVQKVVEGRGYPKVPKEGGDPLLEKLFHGLYGADVLDEGAFTGWRDDDREEGNKRKAVVQTTPWFQWLETEEDEEDEDEDEDIEELNNI